MCYGVILPNEEKKHLTLGILVKLQGRKLLWPEKVHHFRKIIESGSFLGYVESQTNVLS